MKKGFVIGLSFLMSVTGQAGPGVFEGWGARGDGLPMEVGSYAAGFDCECLELYDPAKADGISRVGEPDWEAAEGCRDSNAEDCRDDSAENISGGAGRTSEAEMTAETPDETGADAALAVPEETEWVSLGDDWVITYYCPLACCNDQWAWQTSTREPMQLHHTIAVDPSVIPYYSHVRIGGLDYEYVAEDCGGGIKGKRIDVLVANCEIANEMGVDRNVEVWVQKR